MTGSRTVSGGMKLFAGRFGVSLFSLVFYGAAARWAADRGQLTPLVAMAILAELFRVVGNMGLSTTLLRRVPGQLARGERERAAALVRATLLSVTGSTLVLGAICWLSRDTVSRWLLQRPAGPQEMALIIAFAVLMGLYDVLQITLMASQRFGRQSLAYLITLGGQRLLALGLLFALGITGCLIGFTAGAALGVAVCLFWLRREVFGGLRAASIRELVGFSMPYYAQGFARYVFHEGDQLIVALALPRELLVNYFMAKRIAHGIRMMIDAGTDALRPRTGELAEAGEQALARGFAASSRFLTYVVTPVTLGAAALSSPLMVLFAGPRYAEAGPILCVLSLAMLMYGWFSLYEVSIHMLGRPVHRLWVDLVCAGVTAAAFVIAVRHLQELGVAVAQLVGFTAASLFSVGVLSRIRPMVPDRSAIRRGLLASGLMFATVSATAACLPEGYWVPFHVAAGGVVFASVLHLVVPASERRDIGQALPQPFRWLMERTAGHVEPKAQRSSPRNEV